MRYEKTLVQNFFLLNIFECQLECMKNLKLLFAFKRFGGSAVIFCIKKAKIRNRHNQIPYLTHDTIWESENTHKETAHTREPRGQPLPIR